MLDALFRERPVFTCDVGAFDRGYGRYHYRYKSGREGEFLATGIFSAQDCAFDLHHARLCGFRDILSRLGKHKLGKSCLYVNKLADIDLDV